MKQENKQENKQACKRLTFKNASSDEIKDTVLLGLILSEDENFITFRTGKKEYTISKRVIVSIEDTDIIFQEVR